MSMFEGYDRQNGVTNRLPMPVDSLADAAFVNSISGETLQLKYWNGATLTTDAGQAAGTVVIAKFAYSGILDSLGAMIGNETDTSVVFTTGTVLTAEVRCDYSAVGAADNSTLKLIAADLTANMSNGQYCIDYRNGVLYGKKATTSTSDTVAYKVASTTTGGGSSIVGSIDIAKVGTVAVPTSGADAVSNTRSDVPVSSRLSGFNGTTWDRLRTAVVTATSTLTGWLNTLPWAIYNATAPTKTDGQGGPLQTDSLGNLQSNLYTQIFGEDATLNLLGTQNKPVASAAYAWSIDRSTALEASSISKAAAGLVRAVDGRVDSTAPTGTYYIQLLNSATLPVDGPVTTLIAPKKIQHAAGTDTNFSVDCTMNGVYSSAGIVVVLSSTEYTKTISGAYISSTVYYI